MLRVILAIRTLLFPLLDGLLLLIPSKVHSGKVLIVKLDVIGDFVVWLDAGKALLAHHKSVDGHLVLLGNHIWAAWAQEMGLADEVWGINPKKFSENPLYRLKWLWKIRTCGFEIAVQPSFSRMFLTGDSIVRISGADKRTGSTGDVSNIRPILKKWSNRWYTDLIPASSDDLMEFKRNAEFLRGLGISDYKAGLPTIPYQPKDDKFHPPKPYAVIVPSAGWSGRSWPVNNFTEIGNKLIAAGLNIVIMGASSDHQRAEIMIAGLSASPVNLVAKTSLGEFAEVIRSAAVVVANETSAVHVSVAVDVPVVCILGGGHYGRFVPYQTEVNVTHRKLPIVITKPMPCFGCNWQCHFPRQQTEAVKCIQDIPVDAVWDQLKTLFPQIEGLS